MDTTGSNQDSVIIVDVLGEETDVLVGVSQSNRDLLDESQMSKAIGESHD